jgi:hypothetical protein
MIDAIVPTLDSQHHGETASEPGNLLDRRFAQHRRDARVWRVTFTTS